jgi:hypothetical protein
MCNRIDTLGGLAGLDRYNLDCFVYSFPLRAAPQVACTTDKFVQPTDTEARYLSQRLTMKIPQGLVWIGRD